TAWVLTLCMGPGKDTYSIPLPSLGGIDISTMLGTAWHMMSIVSNGTSMTIYLDGVNLYIQDMQMAFGIQDDFVVGANALNGTTLNTFLPADMACLRFYDRVLTGQEITQIFNTGM
ncbi:MAG TPA: LamG domain-containing protein, partial [Bacteroidales bacterium]|nr:LamG domain-containing protein [Bacteroidales bacterium]